MKETQTIQGNKENSEKVGIYSMTMIGVAYAITLNNFTVGAGVASGMSFGRCLLAIFIAWIALALVWTFSGLMGQISGKNAAEIFKFVFGTKGYKIPSLLMAIALMVWAFFDFWYVGAAMSNMFPKHSGIAFAAGIILVTACAIIGTIKDIGSLKWLTGLTAPLALVMFLIILVATINCAGGMEVIVAYKPSVEMPLVTAVNTMFASFISVTAGFSDITCNAKSKKAVIIAMPISMLVVAFQFIVAQFGTYGMAIVDFTSLALAIGGAVFYVSNVFVLFAQGNTVPGNTMIITTQLSESVRLPKKAMIFVQPLIAAIGAFLIQYGADITVLSSWVGVIACAFGPMLAIMFAEFYLIRKSKLDEAEHLPGFSKAGFISFILAGLLGIYLTYLCPVATPVGIVSFAAGFIIHVIVRKGLRLK